MTKIVACVGLAIGGALLGYVGLVNYVLYDWVSQGAEVANPSKFFNEQILLLMLGYTTGIPAYVHLMTCRKEV